MEVEDKKEYLENMVVAGAKPFVVVGIPAFNEENSIAKIILEAQKYADLIVVCDDGSSDLTADISKKMGAIVVEHCKNLGKGKALKSLFEEISKVKPDVIVTIDADGQHNANEIPNLIAPIIKGDCDIVVGSRYINSSNGNTPLYRRFGLSIINWFNRKANKSELKDTQNGFRAYSFAAFKAVSSHESNGYSVESEQLMLAKKACLKVSEVSVDVKYKGIEKTSKKAPLTHGLGLIGFILKKVVEEKPLRFLGLPGIISMLMGVLFGIWMLRVYAIEKIIITNVALASIAFILIGFFCLSMAITLSSIIRLEQKINSKSKLRANQE